MQSHDIMKQFFLFALATITFAACSENFIGQFPEGESIDDYAPQTLTIGFENEDSRIQLNEEQKTVWTRNDLVSVFYRSDANQKWQYTGETGERVGKFTRLETGNATTSTTRVVVVYPYNENYYFNSETFNIQASLPAVQTYLKDSYGPDGNIMISQGEYNNFSLKNVCGWLKLQITGNGESIRSITVRGNNDEQVAGELYINSSDGTSILASDMGDISEDDENASAGTGGSLVFDDTILTEVTLSCSTGVKLGAENTAFYIALPPQTFTKGITVEITDSDGCTMTKSTDKPITIQRNYIQPMAAFAVDITPSAPVAPDNEIWYTSTKKAYVLGSGWNVSIKSHEWDETTGKGVITFNGVVTTVAPDAFRANANITSITLPNSINKIGYGAFASTSSLDCINIPDGVTDIGIGAFSNSGISSIVIPQGMTSLRDYLFDQCTRLADIRLPENLTSIGVSTFSGCKSLTDTNLPETLTSIGGAAFYQCSSLKSIKIPDKVEAIKENTFYQCWSLESVTLGKGIASIANRAFYNCSKITEIYCKAQTPPALYVYDSYDSSLPFNSGMKIYVPHTSYSIYMQYTTPSTSSTTQENWYNYQRFIEAYDYGSGTIVDEIKNYEIRYSASEKVVPQADAVFGASITSNEWNQTTGKGVITFDKDITEIGDGAFKESASLETITIPNRVKSIGDSAFSGCTRLYTISIPNSVTTIGNEAFKNCTALYSITLGSRLSSIGDNGFFGCKALDLIYCKATTPPELGEKAFNEDSVYQIRCSAYVPVSSLGTYKSTSVWKSFSLVGYNF